MFALSLGAFCCRSDRNGYHPGPLEPSICRASGLDGALSRMQTNPDCRDEKGRSEPQVGSDDVLAAWVLSDVSRGRSRSTSYSPLMNSRRSAFILPGSTIAIPWEPPGYTFKIA